MRATDYVLGILGIFSCIALGQVVERAADFHLKVSNGPDVIVNGVCEPSADKFRCWKPDGTPDKDLEEFVSGYFLSRPDEQLRIAFRSPTRLVIITGLTGMINLTVTTARGDEFRSFSTIAGAGRRSITLMWLYPSSEDRILDTNADITQYFSGPATAAKEGAFVEFGPYKFTVAEIDKKPILDRELDGIPGPDAVWRIRLREEKVENVAGEWTFSVEPEFLDGNRIQEVDAKGRPITKLHRSGYVAARAFYRDTAMQNTWMSLIDPKYIGRLRFTHSKRLRIHLGKLHLYPKSP
jgi:hypothetical protein